MKTNKIIYWTTTIIIFLFEGVIPTLFLNSEPAKEGLGHLGYPEYFGILLLIFRIPGALALLLPMIPARIKEWAYAGFAFVFISGSISHWFVDGFGGQVIYPIIALGVLALSYVYHHKMIKYEPHQQSIQNSHL